MRNKRIAFLLIILLVISPAFASGDTENVSTTLSTEITNGRTIDIFPFLPAAHLPAGITVHLFMLLLSAVIVISVFVYGSLRASLKPKGWILALESVILFVQDDVVIPVMGEDRGKKWLPFFCTLFVFLLIVNLLGLIPAFKTATGNINVTTGLASIILILIFWVGIKNFGILKFFKNLYPSGTALPIGLFVAFLEFAGIFIKTLVLSLRLFANMFAGHLAIFSFLMLIFILNPLFVIVALPFTVFTYLLEVLIGLIQAFVFTLLSCIFITMASSSHE